MCISLHFLYRFESQERETLGHDIGSGLTQSHSVHVDVDDLAGGAVLLDAITNVVEFRKCGAHFVQELTERMEAQIDRQTDNRLRESQQQFRQFHLLFMGQRNSVGRRFSDLLLCHVGRPGDAPDPSVGVKEVHGRVALVLQHLGGRKV